MKTKIIQSLLVLSLYSFTNQSFSTELSFSQAKVKLTGLYKNTGLKTFYCNCDIQWQEKLGVPIRTICGYKPRKSHTKNGSINQRATRIEWEHVFPAYWFGNQLQCWKDGGRKNCRKDKDFRAMEGDMHNLYPAIGELNADRSNYRFGMIEGEPRIYGECDFEVDFKNRVAEPRPEIRGDIARIYFYMSDKYNLRLSKQQEQLLKVWNNQDPVDDIERLRNAKIASIQGNSNPFIDPP
ncbi:endonuclease [Magnetovirga frankeli]|uniref:endonuclease n=1 Tax=Magnetovirga frankeli TaxID=947516 RepID=UPI0012930336|nr:endonuclease [gamma proteobacterium SS-5]